MIKKSIYALYTLLIVCIGFATIIEKYRGTAYVSDNIYGAWWFVVLWALLTAASVAYMVKAKLYRRVAVALLHFSFVVILAGALTTWLTAERGTVSLRTGKTLNSYTDNKGGERTLPFSLTLKRFNVVNYPGTDAAQDYQSVVSVKQDGESHDVIISMNNIGAAGSYRLFQSSFDSDMNGVTLGVYRDPIGITVTYAGYLLFLLGVVFTLLSRKTEVRSLYRKAVQVTCIAMMLCCGTSVSAANIEIVDADVAHSFGTVNVLYNSRICPVNTVATDFVTKLAGKPTWNGYSADEIFMSWMIYYSSWEEQKIIRIKSSSVQRMLGIDGQWASYSDFIDHYNEYKLKDAIANMQSGKNVEDRKGLLDADEKFHVVEMFYKGQMLRIFPYKTKGGINWYTPGSQVLPRDIPVKEQFFIKQAMDFLTESIVTGQQPRALEIIAKIKLFQKDMAGSVLPSKAITNAEITYNRMNSQRWVVFLSLTLGLLICVATNASWRFTQRRWFRHATLAYVSVLAAYLTALLAMRWWVGNHIPVSNGYETMQFMAWALLIITLLLHRKFPIIIGFGTLIAAFCLLVAMLAGGSPQITQLMPVLQSPLLSVHVMTVMCAYALFALQVLLGIQSLWLLRKNDIAALERSTALSMLLLYPAVFLLGIGIFLGAVWANVSWGTYWSWDPKETWALITFMVYAVPLHRASVPSFSNPRTYHIYIICAFVTVLTTYFGVNFILGGMHSYA